MSDPVEDPNAAADAAIARVVGQAHEAKAPDVIRRIDACYPAAAMMLAYLEAQNDQQRAESKSYRENLGAWCSIMRDARDLLKNGLAK